MKLLKSTVDERDYKLSQYTSLADPSKELTEYILPLPDKSIALNQYRTPTCVGQACAMAKMISEYMLTNKWISLSPYSIYGYYNNDGNGMSIRYGIEVLYKWGCLPTANFSEKGDNPELYNKLKKYRDTHPEAEEIASRYKIDSYVSLRDFDDIKRAVFNGMPVVGAVNADSSFGQRPNGIEPRYPNSNAQGHAICFVGWKVINDTQYLIAINSWGNKNGLDGRVYIPKGRQIEDLFAISDLHTPVLKKHKRIEFRIGAKSYKTEDGEVEFDVSPYIRNNRTFLPVRFVSEALGCSVDWDAVNSTATITSEEGQFLKVKTNSNILIGEKNIIEMDTPTEISNNRMMCPIRYIAEALSFKVDWVAKTSTAIITSL